MGFSGILVVLLVIGAVWGRSALSEQERLVDYLMADVERLQKEVELLSGESADLAAEMDDLRAEKAVADEALAATQKTLKDVRRNVTEEMVPREVNSTADFPIERGMAKNDESVADFAKREGTSVEVLKALNPWLDPKQPLKRFQALWLPKGKS